MSISVTSTCRVSKGLRGRVSEFVSKDIELAFVFIKGRLPITIRMVFFKLFEIERKGCRSKSSQFLYSLNDNRSEVTKC